MTYFHNNNNAINYEKAFQFKRNHLYSLILDSYMTIIIFIFQLRQSIININRPKPTKEKNRSPEKTRIN